MLSRSSSPRLTQAGIITFYFACTCRDSAVAKVPGGVAGVKQRNRFTAKCNCSRKVTVNTILNYSGEHTCSAVEESQQVSRSAASTVGISAKLDAEIISKIQNWRGLGVDIQGVYRLITGEFKTAGLGEPHPQTLRSYVTRALEHVPGDIAVISTTAFYHEIKTKMINRVNVRMIEDYSVQLLIGAAWREPDWRPVSEFCLFFVDGTAKLVLGDYVVIFVLGLTQLFTAELVAVVVATAENSKAYQLGFDIMEKDDPTIFEREITLMSDESTGLAAALFDKPKVHHNFCALHQSANMTSNMDLKSESLDESNSTTTTTTTKELQFEILERQMNEAATIIGARTSMRANIVDPVREPDYKSFGSWQDNYAAPSKESVCHSTNNWLMYLRTSPSEVHFWLVYVNMVNIFQQIVNII